VSEIGSIITFGDEILNRWCHMCQFKLKDKPNHPIVKVILKYEPDTYGDDVLIVYSPHFDSVRVGGLLMDIFMYDNNGGD